MASTFTRARGGRVKVRLGDADRGVVAGLLEAVADLLEPVPPDAAGAGPSAASDEDALLAQLEADLVVEPPADPAVARLLPDGSRDDPELAQSFRRLTEQDLRERKRDSLGLAAAALRRSAPVVLVDSEAQALLKGLTDVRLVLAERLGIATDEDAEFLHAALAAGAGQGQQEWAKAAELYEVVTYLQEELVRTLLP
jgi:Domain of unknown function (DUF2017)